MCVCAPASPLPHRMFGRAAAGGSNSHMRMDRGPHWMCEEPSLGGCGGGVGIVVLLGSWWLVVVVVVPVGFRKWLR